LSPKFTTFPLLSSQEQRTSDAYVQFRDHQEDEEQHFRGDKKKLISLLLLIATLALSTAVILATQLYERHFREENVQLTFVSLEKWEEKSHIFFPQSVENDLLKKSRQEVQDQILDLRNSKVVSASFPSNRKCGRGLNRFVKLSSGSEACARNRGILHPELVQGEVMAFHLARILGISNVPTVVLSKVRKLALRYLVSYS